MRARGFQQRQLRFTFGLLVLTLNFLTQPIQAEELPRAQGYVSDFAQVIPVNQRQQIEQRLTQLEETTGAEIAVVTLSTLADQPIEDYTVRLFETWGIGKKGHDNGLLILAAINDRKGRIEVGYGLEGVIPDALAGRILRDVIFSAFKQGQYGTGLLDGVNLIAERVERAHEGKPLGKTIGDEKPSHHLVWIFRLLLLIGMIILFIKNPMLFLFLMSSVGGGGRSSSGFGRSGGFGSFGGGLSGGGGASGSW